MFKNLNPMVSINPYARGGTNYSKVQQPLVDVKNKKRWIPKTLKKGALTKAAPAEAKTKSGTLKVSWLRKQAKKGGKIGARARLALAFRKMKKRKKK